VVVADERLWADFTTVMNIRPITHESNSSQASNVFWRAQVAVWLLLALVGFCIRFIIFGNALAAFWLTIVLEPLAFVLTSAAALAHGRYGKNTALIPTLAFATLLCLLASALLPAIGYVIHGLFPPGSIKGVAEAQYRLGFFYYMGIFWIWTLIYFGVGAELAARNARISKMKAENRAMLLELEHLQRQIEPHFLFNALNAVVAEIADRPALAEELTRRLADYLRYSLDRRGRGTSRLAEELEAAESYIRIQALRFDERLEFQSSVDPAALDFELPHMTLQGLVENAIKHGMRAEYETFLIQLDVRCNAEELVIELSNPGRLQTTQLPKGSQRRGGLGNLSRRLALYYPDRHEFSLGQLAGRTVARITLRGKPVELDITGSAA